jgi:hypothetical protein
MPFRSAVVLLLVLTAGCHAHTPVSLTQITPGEQVRVRVTQVQAQALEPLLLRERQVLDGTVLAVSPQLLLEVPVASHLQGGTRQDLRQRIALEPSQVLGVELRELDRFRTGLLVTAGGAFLVGAVALALSREAGGDTRGETPPPAELRGPTLQIPWGGRP